MAHIREVLYHPAYIGKDKEVCVYCGVSDEDAELTPLDDGTWVCEYDFDTPSPERDGFCGEDVGRGWCVLAEEHTGEHRASVGSLDEREGS